VELLLEDHAEHWPVAEQGHLLTPAVFVLSEHSRPTNATSCRIA
jgi:hypothetical protein